MQYEKRLEDWAKGTDKDLGDVASGHDCDSIGLGGTRKSDMKPFQWDTALPKLADRKMLNMLVN